MEVRITYRSFLVTEFLDDAPHGFQHVNSEEAGDVPLYPHKQWRRTTPRRAVLAT